LEALADTPVVFLQGARQTGKSTLAQAITGKAHRATYLSLDDISVLAAAQGDPVGFIEGQKGRHVIIDEVQRARGWLWPSKPPLTETARQAGSC